MDKFTETYIEMVIKAKEIQGLCKYQEGDWFYFDEFDWEIMRDGDNRDWYKNNYKWLPTLEDLFGIADWGHYSINKNIGDHGYYYGKENLFGEIKYPGETFSSLKEMVLAVVMEINYNKSWNGKEWEEINGS